MASTPDPPQTSTKQTEDSILDYLVLLSSYRRMITLVTTSGFLAALVTCLLLPNYYRTRTLILPPQQDQNLMGAMLAQMGGLANLAGDMLGGGNQADMYVGIIKSEAVKDPIIDRFNLINAYDSGYRVKTYKEIDKYVTVTVGKKDGIIDISVEDKNPKKAADMANAYVEELGKLLIRMNTSGAGQNKSFLAERLASARVELAKAEDALKEFQTKNKTVDVTEQAKGTIKGIADLTAQLLAMQVQLASVQRQFTDNSQEVKTLKQSISTLKAQIAKFEGNGSSGVIPSVGSVPEIGQKYIRLMRDYKIQETLVELLTKQYEMSNLTEAKAISTIQVIQKARIPDRKSNPKRALIIIESTLASFGLAIFIALLVVNFNKLPESQKSTLLYLVNSVIPKRRTK